jgi:hypothetical protein
VYPLVTGPLERERERESGGRCLALPRVPHTRTVWWQAEKAAIAAEKAAKKKAAAAKKK